MKCMVLILFLIFTMHGMVFAENRDKENFKYKTITKTVDGINFELPEDRPVEKKNGIITPMPIDEYVAMKFWKMENNLKEMDASIAEIRADLDKYKAEDREAMNIRLKKIEDFIAKFKESFKPLE